MSAGEWIRCSGCHQVHGNQNVASLIASDEVCLELPPGEGRQLSAAEHTHHGGGAAG
jgi:hypothetical protein